MSDVHPIVLLIVGASAVVAVVSLIVTVVFTILTGAYNRATERHLHRLREIRAGRPDPGSEPSGFDRWYVGLMRGNVDVLYAPKAKA